MLFSSNIFIFIFLPAVIAVYYLIPRRARSWRNIFLCIASLFFYAWGEPRFVLVLMLSIYINWLFGLLVDRYRAGHYVKGIIALDIFFNLIIIFIFKYLSFTVQNLNSIFGSHITDPGILLPIGISFFTFQAISYVIDVYRGKGVAQKNIFYVALYISFFPQLIAGPIVRYETIADQIYDRKENFNDFSAGVCRFMLGLAKKVLISNNMAIIADQAFGVSGGEPWLGVSITLPTGMAWLGAVAYTMQIFFDFSGYSDMAIGLGRMFGFHFLENFNYPYISSSVTEFWRRWHISLGTWFRDYVYIPMGGSRCSRGRNVLNLFIVWLLTGIWHGANWTFITWGLMYFGLLVFEKNTPFDINKNSAIKHIYTMFFVIIGWVVFRAENLGAAIDYISRMFAFDFNGDGGITLFYTHEYWAFLVAAVIFSLPVVPALRKKIAAGRHRTILQFGWAVILLGLFMVSVSYIVKGSYNPFIYFNF